MLSLNAGSAFTGVGRTENTLDAKKRKKFRNGSREKALVIIADYALTVTCEREDPKQSLYYRRRGQITEWLKKNEIRKTADCAEDMQIIFGSLA
jgi:hypothetical protein